MVLPLKSTSSVHNIDARPDFGSRFLKEDSDVWSHNAWDHVEAPAERLAYVEEALQRQRDSPVPAQEHSRYNKQPARHWDAFYRNNATHFFKDRKWIQLEFPQIADALRPDAGPYTILEVGCGVGNTVLPILVANANPDLHIFASDYSAKAIDLLKSSPKLSEPHTGTLDAFVWDLASPVLPEELPTQSIDLLVMVFVLSAVHPDEWRQAVQNAYQLLKPGGLICFRDYGRYDLAQVRFKAGRLLQENFYIRGDGTRVYFFDLDELSVIFSNQHLTKDVPISIKEAMEEEEEEEEGSSNPNEPPDSIQQSPHQEENTGHCGEMDLATTETLSLFHIHRIGVDRRLLVNRKRQLKMYRVWVQASFMRSSP